VRKEPLGRRRMKLLNEKLNKLLIVLIYRPVNSPSCAWFRF
jgi:hypothetical protein